MNSIAFLETFAQDVRYAFRTMRHNPSFALTAALSLALGIGGNTAIFTVIRAVLLSPLHYKNPGQLVYLSVDNPRKNVRDGSFTLAQFDEMKATARSFADLGVYGRPENVILSGDGEPEALKGARVSANFLDILGVQPVLGRSFLPEEDRRGGRPVAMISYRLWRRRFGGDPRLTGKTAAFDATGYTIVGVLPDGFQFPFADVDIWLTKPAEWSLLPPRYWGIATLTGFARLRSQVTLAQANSEMNVLQHQYTNAHPGPLTDPNSTMRVVLLRDRLVASAGPLLWTLFGAVGFVLLIACANVASLLLARATARVREFALRAALGAGRGRLMRQLLAESLVVAMAGGILGVFLAKCGLEAIARMNALLVPGGVNALYVPGVREIRLDATVLCFTIGLSIASAVLFGLFPSLQISRPDLAEALRASGGRIGGTAARREIFGMQPRNLLVVCQVALSVVLLIAASLLMQSFAHLRAVNPGFEPANLLSMKIALPPARYDTDPKKASFFQELLPAVEALPGVRGAAVTMSLPTTTWIKTNIIEVQGKPAPDPNEPSTVAVLQSVTPGYFHTLGIPLKQGREFSSRDNTSGAPPVMIVNESLARRIWPDYAKGGNPIGLHIKEGYDKAAGWMEVVGIAADIREGGLADDAVPEFYVPAVVHPPQTAYLVVRTIGDPNNFADAIRQQVLAVDRDQAVSEIRTVEAVLDATLGQRRVTMGLLGLFAGAALLLALIGIYGVIAYSVAQRTQEVGIRRALGAQQWDVLRLMLWQGLLLTLSGCALGIGAAFGVTRFLKGLLFGMTATDPATFAGIPLLFVAAALMATFLPAWRAARIDPMVALRIG
jgi:predicted permease